MGQRHGFSVSAQSGHNTKKLLRAAVAAASSDKDEPPPPLRLYWQCMKWGTLPKAGGMYDQDYRQMHMMNILSKVFDAAKAWHHPEKKMTSDQTQIIKWLVSIGIK
jgi:hypothetical protein